MSKGLNQVKNDVGGVNIHRIRCTFFKDVWVMMQTARVNEN